MFTFGQTINEHVLISKLIPLGKHVERSYITVNHFATNQTFKNYIGNFTPAIWGNFPKPGVIFTFLSIWHV